MKNACKLIVCVIVLLVATSSYADETCSVSTVTLNGLSVENIVEILDALQTNRGIGAPPDVACYEIQFVSIAQIEVDNRIKTQINNIRPFDGSFTYQPDSSDSRPIYISGLNIKQSNNLVLPTDPALGREKSFLNIISTAGRRVILKDSTLANVRYGILIDGDGPVEISNSTITGDIAKTGYCLAILADNSSVKSTTISNCNTGVSISASNTLLGASDAAMYDEEKNTLTGNTIGIHQVSGAGNRWPYNSICGGNGIVVDGGIRPVVRAGEGAVADLNCTLNGEGVTGCTLQFDSPPNVDGEVQFYRAVSVECAMQGQDYVAKCVIGGDNVCAFDAANSLDLRANLICGGNEPCYFTALSTGLNSTMYVTDPFKMKPSDRTATISIIATPGPVEMPGASDSGNDSGDLSSEGSDQISFNDPNTGPSSDPAFDPAATDDNEGRDATAADGPAATARCTMISSALFNLRHMAISFIFLILPALIIITLRQKNRHRFS